MFYFKASFHSFVDVITNSSTVIFVNNDGVPAAIERLIEEMGKVLGFTETANDMFIISVLLDDDDKYVEYLSELDEGELQKIDPTLTADDNFDEYVNILLNNIIHGKVEYPEWMDSVSSDYFQRSELHIIARDDKYEPVGKALFKLVNAQEIEAEYDS